MSLNYFFILFYFYSTSMYRLQKMYKKKNIKIPHQIIVISLAYLVFELFFFFN